MFQHVQFVIVTRMQKRAASSGKLPASPGPVESAWSAQLPSELPRPPAVSHVTSSTVLSQNSWWLPAGVHLAAATCDLLPSCCRHPSTAWLAEDECRGLQAASVGAAGQACSIRISYDGHGHTIRLLSAHVNPLLQDATWHLCPASRVNWTEDHAAQALGKVLVGPSRQHRLPRTRSEHAAGIDVQRRFGRGRRNADS